MITDTLIASDEVQINAPAELVWQILVDFENYGKWNSFCPRIINTALEPGAAVDMMIDLGNGLQQQVEYITLVEPNRTIAWGMENKPGDPIHAVRTQKLKALDSDSCSYVSIDDFSGESVAVMIELMGTAVETGFNRCAYELKHYAEALVNDSET
jgi:uncharacterized protein YndB with AHSA1/START domain